MQSAHGTPFDQQWQAPLVRGSASGMWDLIPPRRPPRSRRVDIQRRWARAIARQADYFF